MMRAILSILLAVTLSIATAVADYVQRDGNGALITIHAGTCSGMVCPYTTLIDLFGNPLGTQSNPLFTSPLATTPVDVTGAVTGPVVGTASGQVLAAGTHRYIEIVNQSSTATMTCRLNGTPAAGGAASIDVFPKSGYSWGAPGGPPLVHNALNCLSTAASTNATLTAY